MQLTLLSCTTAKDGECKKFWVNGHLAGACRSQTWSNDDRAKASPADLIDSLLANYKTPEELICENGPLKHLTKALVARALEAEMAEHLSRDKNELVCRQHPRERHANFEPQLVPRHQTH